MHASPAIGDVALDIQSLTKTFFRGTPDEVVALSEIDLRLAPGDFVTVVGSNGAGKSTLLNAICGTYPVDAGRVLLDGQDVSGLAEHDRARYVGRVTQDPKAGTAASLSVEQNLALALLRGMPRRLGQGVTQGRRA